MSIMTYTQPQSKSRVIAKAVKNKIRQWRIDAGGQSVLIDDMPMDAYDKQIAQFHQDALDNYKKTHWLKHLVNCHRGFFGRKIKVRIMRGYHQNCIGVDFYGGRCARYDYNGKWIAG